MEILVIGGGGREHALIKALRKNPQISGIYALPGNGGMAGEAECHPIKATDIDGIAAFAAEKKVGFAVVAQDDPLALGAVDRLHAMGIPCFGPDAKAALIEASKAFSKGLMRKYNIPTAAYAEFSDVDGALAHVAKRAFPAVVKADGLALGKGVFVCETRAEGEAAVRALMSEGLFGKSGATVVIEDKLSGPEVSVLAFTDGEALVTMPASTDHKRALDGDLGPNTGGMGAIAPSPYYTAEIAARCREEIFLPTIRAMKAEGRPFKGCLYFGLMLTEDGPKVIEYNCRFGDPEAQAVLPLLKSDLFEIMRAVEEERLGGMDVEFADSACCCTVVVSGGYPGAYKKGLPISLGDVGEAALYSAGTALSGGALVTSGGRVMGVSCLADTLEEAVAKSRAAAAEVRFDGAYFRSDIGAKALKWGKTHGIQGIC